MYDIIYLTLSTDKGNIAFELCSDLNAKSADAMNALLRSVNEDISFSLYSERKYMFISEVERVLGETVDTNQLFKVTGCMIDPL